MTWETATNASMTPRAATPWASAADDKPSDFIDLDKMTDSILDLSHGQAQESVQDLARTSEARILGRGEEEQGVTRSYRQDWNTDSHFARLKWQLEFLLADLEAGKTIEYSQIELYELWLSAFEPSRKSEENLISLFEDTLTKIKAEERMKRRSLLSQTHSCLCVFKNEHLWNCCACGDGGSTTAIVVGCAMCGHHRCRNCHHYRLFPHRPIHDRKSL
jgi:hypothetical protein